MSFTHGRQVRHAVVLMSLYRGDRPDYFREALSSVLDQELPVDIQLSVYLAVDGPISTELEDVLSEFGPRLSAVSRSPVNLGLGESLNRLISETRGSDFFFRMDADDVSLPGRFKSQIDFLDKNPGVDIVGGSIVEFSDASGQARRTTFFNGKGDVRKWLCWRVPVAHPSVCFRGRVFDILRGYPTSNGNEDISLWFACAGAGLQFSNIEPAVIRFRITSNFWRRRALGKAFDEFLAYERGIFYLFGLSWRLMIPLLRFVFRVLPTPVVKLGYRLRSWRN